MSNARLRAAAPSMEVELGSGGLGAAMIRAGRSAVGALFALVLVAANGCSGDDWPNCVTACKRQVAAGCSKGPNYGASCEDVCAAAKDRTPERCWDKAEAVHACVVREVTWECAADGTLHAVPLDACTKESDACFACSGDVIVCFGD